MSAPTVYCAKCCRAVDKLEWFDDLASGERVVRAYCHGSVDEMRIDMMTISIDVAMQLNQQVGIAFSSGQQALGDLKGGAA